MAEASPSSPEERSAKRPRLASSEMESDLAHAGMNDDATQTELVIERKILKEEDVGITEYLDPSIPPFRAVIKQRFSDFQVREIALDGSVRRITSLNPPKGRLTDLLEREEAERKDPELARRRIEQERKQREEERQKALEIENDRTWPDGADERLKETGWTEEQVAAIKVLWQEGRDGSGAADKGSEDASSAARKEEAESTEDQSNNDARPRQRQKPFINPHFVVSAPIKDKAQRSAAHATMRELFGGKLITETYDTVALAKKLGDKKDAADKEDDDANNADDGDAAANKSNDSFILVKWGTGGKGDRRGGNRPEPRNDANGESSSPEQHPPYIQFLMQKANRDSADALGILGRTLGLFNTNRELAIAGTKDRRAVTVQAVSLKRGRKTVEDIWLQAHGVKLDGGHSKPGGRGGRGGRGRGGRGVYHNDRDQHQKHSILEAVQSRGDRGIRIAHLEYVDEPLHLGQLRGNEFVITLRNVRFEKEDEQDSKVALEETIEKAVEVIRSRGYINYYGMQRFGTSDIATHAVGIPIFQKNFKRAVELILADRSSDTPDATRARKLYRDGKYSAAFEAMPRSYTAERGILGKMLKEFKINKKLGNDWLGYLHAAPKYLRQMYVHAYQSYLWNLMVSKRLQKSREVLVGDIVAADGSAEGEDALEDGVDMQDGMEEDQEDQSEVRKKPATIAIKVLTEEDLPKYSLKDVYIPLPGLNVSLPDGWMRDMFVEELGKEGLKPEDLFSQSSSEYVMQGTYRKILGQPKNVRAKLLRYADTDIDLAVSDEGRLLGKPEPVSLSEEEGPFLALQLTFELGASHYATMVLREVLKTDTSSAHQRELTLHGEDQALRGSASNRESGARGDGLEGSSSRGRGKVNFIQAKRKRTWGAATAEGEATTSEAAVDAPVEAGAKGAKPENSD